MPQRNQSELRSLLGLAFVSAGMLAFEVGLTRLFAVQQFHHFAFMVVSLAVLGISASGLMLSLQPEHPPLGLLAGAFSLAVGLSYALINLLPFDSYAIAWDRRQVWILALYFTAAGLPFLFAGWAAGGSMAAAGEQAHRPYAAVFVGSGLGAPAALAAHAWGGATAAVSLAALLGLVSLLLLSSRRTVIAAGGLLAFILVGASAARPDWIEPQLSPYKPLDQARRAADAAVAETQWGPVSRLDAVEGAGTHVFPGLSLGAGGELPEQIGLYLDGGGPLPVTRLDPSSASGRDLARRFPTYLAYQLRPDARVLIIAPGGGLEAQIALASGAKSVTLARDNPLVLQALEEDFSAFNYGLLQHDRLRLARRASRGLLAEPQMSFDLVIFALSEPYRPVTSGAFSLQEDYILTQQSFQAAHRALNDRGLLVVTRWLGTPPSESARAWATLLAALEREGVSDIRGRAVAYRSLRTMTMVAGRNPLGEPELAEVRPFLEANSFDPVVLPDLEEEELNRHNRLPEPVYHSLFVDLMRSPSETLKRYDFELDPPTDHRPYFFHFFRWRQTPDVLRTLGLTMQPFGGSGYFVLLALLALMTALALPLIAVPAWVLHRRGTSRPGWRPSLYFGALGAGYLLFEVPLISWFGLLLDHPAASLATVLFTIMFASGVGSWLSPYLSLRKALSVLVIMMAITVAILPWVVQTALPWPLWARISVAVGLLLPAGTLMGVPFAAGLRRLERAKPGLIPWAWGVNGAISGISGVLGALIAIDFGFSVVLAVAAAAYALARFTIPDCG